MPWARVDDDFYDHPKVTELLAEPDGWGALGFWVACLAWAHKHTRKPGRRAGFMSRLDVIRMDRNVGEQYAGLLSKVHLWEPVDDGWLIHDFSLYLPKQATSAARAEAGRKGGLKSGQVRAAQSVERSTELQAGSKELQNRSKREASSEATPEANAGLGRGSVVEVSTGSPSVEVAAPNGALTINQRSKKITDAYSAAEPMSKWPAVNGIVIKAINSGRYSDDEIEAALLRLAAEKRSVTVDSLRTELDGFTPRSGARASTMATSDQRAMMAIEAAQRVQARNDARKAIE